MGRLKFSTLHKKFMLSIIIKKAKHRLGEWRGSDCDLAVAVTTRQRSPPPISFNLGKNMYRNFILHYSNSSLFCTLISPKNVSETSNKQAFIISLSRKKK